MIKNDSRNKIMQGLIRSQQLRHTSISHDEKILNFTFLTRMVVVVCHDQVHCQFKFNVPVVDLVPAR